MEEVLAVEEVVEEVEAITYQEVVKHLKANKGNLTTLELLLYINTLGYT